MALYTEEIMENAFRTLMHEKKVDNITVNDIIDHAHINRKTFYYHYGSICDLIVSMCTKKINEIFIPSRITPSTWDQTLIEGLSLMHEERSDIEAILYSRYRNEYLMHFSNISERFTKIFIQNAFKDYQQTNQLSLQITDQQFAYITDYYSMAVFGLIKNWFVTGMKETPEELMNTLLLLTNDSMLRVFDSFDQKNRNHA